MTLRLGSKAPNFKAKTTQGEIDFHEYINNSWAILFSHPADFTPVCTTELGEVARRHEDFKQRNVKVLGISANGLSDHEKWVEDINEVNSVNLSFPIIADSERKVSTLYDMLDQQDLTNVDTKGIPFTIRSVFIIDTKKTIRLILSYPASTGRNFDEIIRVIDSLQLGDKHQITTPANWKKKGDDVIIHPAVNNEKAEELFPGYKTVKPYLRFAKSPF